MVRADILAFENVRIAPLFYFRVRNFRVSGTGVRYIGHCKSRRVQPLDPFLRYAGYPLPIHCSPYVVMKIRD